MREERARVSGLILVGTESPMIQREPNQSPFGRRSFPKLQASQIINPETEGRVQKGMERAMPVHANGPASFGP